MAKRPEFPLSRAPRSVTLRNSGQIDSVASARSVRGKSILSEGVVIFDLNDVRAGLQEGFILWLTRQLLQCFSPIW
jgi:hypothetical protein